MPDVSRRYHFHFHAHAQALGGRFHHPLRAVIPTQATASLPTVGGEATAEARDFRFQDFLHFQRAHTHISGRYFDKDKDDESNKDGVFITHASTTIHGLDVLGQVKVARIVSRLVSIHRPGHVEGHIIAEDSHFDGFKVKGREFEIKLHHRLLVEGRTFADLAKAIKTNSKYGKMHPDPDRKVALCTLVESIQLKDPAQLLAGVRVEGNAIIIENFGTLFLAEVYAEPGTRTLTMLRLKLGSPHSADVAAGEAVTNGQSGGPTPP